MPIYSFLLVERELERNTFTLGINFIKV